MLSLLWIITKSMVFFFLDLHRMTLWFVEQVLSFGWSNNACFSFECSVVLNQIQKVNYLIYGCSSISPNPFSWISLGHNGMQNLLLTGLQTETSSTSFLFIHGWKILDIGLNPLNISLSSMFISEFNHLADALSKKTLNDEEGFIFSQKWVDGFLAFEDRVRIFQS